MIRRTLPCLLALLCLPSLGLAQSVASTPAGIAVDVPEGFTWKEGFKFKPTTEIYLEGVETTEHPPTIVVNMIDMRREMPEAELFKSTREVFLQTEGAQAEEVSLASGRFLRVDFDFSDPPRKLRQRLYACMRGTRAFYFFLANLEEEAFKAVLPTFDALVAGARFSEPTPAQAAPQPEATEPQADPDPAPSKPEPAEPEPAPVDPAPVEPETAKPEPAPAEPEPAPATTPISKPTAEPLGASPAAQALPLKLIRWASEYDSDVWGAANLLDQSAVRGWCSSPSDRQPFTFVFELSKPTRVTRLGFDNHCPEEANFEGVASRRVKVEGSLAGPETGYETLFSGELKSGVNDQAFALASVSEQRYLRLSVLSNHGNSRVTELMEFRAYGAPSESPAKPEFHLARARTSREKNGRAEAEPFKAGERLWVNFKPRALATNDEGSTWIEVDLVLADSAGNVLVRRDKVVNHVARPPTAPLSAFVSLFLDLPAEFPAGKYVVRLVARDRVGETSAAAKCEFLVGE